ncbi:hypothetical protein Tcan_13273 [Toxocara canis]|uniref:Uncharacterized protein n=1 Tax=Toxocara canis TaxID=6265 RepID=A0A0B2VPM4_TOXCA|nr:hypothetical protein Tcan_13273 [Toxocara canis]
MLAAESKVERLKRLADSDGNSTFASSVNQSSTEFETVRLTKLSYADIWAMDWGIPYSQIDAPVIIVIEIIFTFFVTGVVLLNGPFRSDYVDVIEKVAHIVSCALSAIFTGHMISSIKTTWKRNELMLIVPIQWKIAMFIMFMLTFVFVAEIFYSKFLFVNFELRKVFGEYDLVKAQETAEGDRSNVIPFGRKQLRSETIVSSDD